MKFLARSFWLTSLLFCLCLGCEKPADTYQPAVSADRFSRLSNKERQDLAPNLLMQAVVAGDLEAVKAANNGNPALRTNTNPSKQDTALGLAIKLRERAIASYLADQLSIDQYFHQNIDGESYVFLAAKAGYTEIIQLLADRYYDSHGDWVDWGFGDLDLANNEGQRALHVASDRRVVELLQTQYYRGTVERPYWGFTLHLDHKGQTFLHTAAAEGRTDVVLWGAEQFCDPSAAEKYGDLYLPILDWKILEGWWIVRMAGTATSRGVKTFQTYIGDLGVYTDLLFNRRDNDGNTALQRAVLSRNSNSVRAISQCRWVDYLLDNNDGNIPLQTALKSIPAMEMTTSSGEREIFDFLLHRETKLRRWTSGRTSYLDHANNEGNSSLHMAADLADPYFYNSLSTEGDIYLKNLNEQTPVEIFEQKQSRVKLYVH